MRFPVFWLALAYAAGLALYAEVDDPPRILFALATVALLAGTIVLRRRWPRWERGWLWTTLTCALTGFFLLGGATIGLAVASIEATRADRLVATGQIDPSEALRLTGWLRRNPEQKPFATFYVLELESIEAGGRVQPASGGVRLSYFPSESQAPAPPLPDLRYGDRVQVLARVRPPLNHQNRGSFDWKAYLARQEIFLEGSLKSPLLLQKLPPAERDGHPALRWIYDLRTHLLARLDQLFPPAAQGDRNAVLRAMLLGDTSFLSHRLSENFRLSGAYHVLVVSGLNVALIAFPVFWLLRRLGLGEGFATLVTIPVLVFYLLLVEDRPPIERAVWMVSLYLLARLLFRQVHLANPLALAVLLVLFLHPEWLFEPSLHLSFGAVFLITFFAVPWSERTSQPYREALGFLVAPERAEQFREPRLVQFRLDLRALAELLSGLVFWTKEKERAALRGLVAAVRLGLRAWDIFLVSFAITLGLVLLTAVYFNRVIWVGLLTNLLVVPLVGWVVPLGLAALLLALVWPAAGALLAKPVGGLVGVLLKVVDSLASSSLSYGISPPPLWLTVLFLAALVWLARAVARQRHQPWAGLALAALILLVVTHPFPPQIDERALEITALDVGQGDSLLIVFPNHETWLLDGGRGPVEIQAGYRVGEAVGETVVTPYLRTRGIKRIDRVWLSHAHHDHMSGLNVVLDEFRVGSFHVGPNVETESYRRLLERVRARGIPLELHQAGERLTVGGVQVEVLWPTRDHRLGREPSNNDSLVLRLCRAENCMLLPGDIEADVERRLAQAGLPLAAAVLKVPHHGGRDAAGSEFLAAVTPHVAIISVGASNPFNHPYENVLERLQRQRVETYRTDRDGSVTVRLEGNGVRVESFRQRERHEPYPNLWARLTACARSLVSLEFN